MPTCPYCGKDYPHYYVREVSPVGSQINIRLIEICCADTKCKKVISVIQDMSHLHPATK